MSAVSDLAEDLRDVILDYQVSSDIITRTLGGSLTQFVVLAAESNIQPKLYTDCESHVPCFEEIFDVDQSLQDAGPKYFRFDGQRLMI